MTIKSVIIENYKSIEYLELPISKLLVIIGKNGTGKTTIMNAIEYFYNNLQESNITNDVFDSVNVYKQKMSITIVYDFNRIYEYSKEELKRQIDKIPHELTFEDGRLIRVKLTQFKKGEILWNLDYNSRYIIKNTHPIFFTSIRSMNLTEWDNIWGYFGDLINANDIGKISLNELLLQSDGIQEYSTIKKNVELFLKQNELSLESETNRTKGIKILQIMLEGTKFKSESLQLKDVSDGTNSYNYLILICFIAEMINKKRLKSVLVIFDEPELGLHPKLIDSLGEIMSSSSLWVNYILFSHSPRLVSNALKNQADVWRLDYKNKYTTAVKLVKNFSTRHKLLMNDTIGSYLFSNFLFFVEGVTEMEIFSHPYILELFPFMKNIEIINTESNELIVEMLDPNKSKSEIAYLILYDLDKFISFEKLKDGSEDKYSIKYTKKGKPLFNNQIKKLFFSFNKYQNNLLSSYKKVNEMINKSFYLSKTQDIIRDSSGDSETMDEFFNSLKDIVVLFNFYPMRIDSEHALVNNNVIIDYFRDEKGMSVSLANELIHLRQKSPLLINYLIFGKNAMLNKIKGNKIINDGSVLKKYAKYRLQKNSGWITEFLNYYQSMQNASNYSRNEEIQNFEKNFKELYDIISYIDSLMIK